MTEQWGVAPILGVLSVLDAVEYFCDVLGFSRPLALHGPPTEPVYAIVRRASVAIHLQLRAGPVFALPRGEHDCDAYILVQSADALRAEFFAKGVKFVRDVQDEPYGLRDFTIETPQGHRVCFGAEL